MIGKVENSLPGTLQDIELKQQDPHKTKLKGGIAPAESSEEPEPDTEPAPPVPPRFRTLGRHLDIIA